jgi:hypothetical protein
MTGLIEDHGLLSDLHTAALVDRDGTVDWLCLPRFDSGACFASLVGDDRHGYWRLAPVGAGQADRRRYRGDTMILEHEWDTDTGTVRVIDFMPPSDGGHDLIRIVEGVRGQVDVHCALSIRFDYGKAVPWVHREGNELIAVAGPDALVLRSDAPTHGKELTTRAETTVHAGDRIHFVLTWYPSHLDRPEPIDPDDALERTETFWTDWVRPCAYRGEHRDAVVRSLLTLKALTFHPTGGGGGGGGGCPPPPPPPAPYSRPILRFSSWSRASTSAASSRRDQSAAALSSSPSIESMRCRAPCWRSCASRAKRFASASLKRRFISSASLRRIASSASAATSFFSRTASRSRCRAANSPATRAVSASPIRSARVPRRSHFATSSRSRSRAWPARWTSCSSSGSEARASTSSWRIDESSSATRSSGSRRSSSWRKASMLF